MPTVKELTAEARKALDAGKMDEYQKYFDLAKAAKALDDLDAAKAGPGATPPARAVARPPFSGGDPAPEPTPAEAAAKTIQAWAAKKWYVKKFGELDPAIGEIVKELYDGVRDVTDFYRLNAAKHAGLNTYLKYGEYDPALKRVVVLSQDQLAEAFLFGNSVAEVKATMIEAQETLAGYSVPEDFHAEVISRLPGLTVVRQRADVRQTARDLYTALVRTGGTSRYIGNVRVVKADESPSGASATASNATFGKVQIPVHTIMANVPLSRSVLEDSAVDLASELQEEFSVALAIFEDEQYLVGNGINGPKGVLKDNAAGGLFDSNGTRVPSGAASTINDGDTVVKTPLKLDAQYRQAGAVWVMAKATREAIALLQDGMGRYLLADNANLLATDEGDKLRRYLLTESEAMPAIGTNNYPILFGDFKGYRIVDRVGMSIERYLDSATAATDTVIYYVRRRGGGQVVQGYRFAAVQCSVS
jgi:HK97 family phage major capsid protein